MKNIILCGFMGTGKSLVGKMLAERLGMSFYDTDELIEKESKMSVAEIFEKFGEEYFRRLETKTIERFLKTENNVIALGGGLAANEANHKILKNCGFIILLDLEIEKILLRISGDQSRPLTVGGNEELTERYNIRKPIYKKIANATLYSGNSPQKTCENAIRLLEDYGIL